MILIIFASLFLTYFLNSLINNAGAFKFISKCLEKPLSVINIIKNSRNQVWIVCNFDSNKQAFQGFLNYLIKNKDTKLLINLLEIDKLPKESKDIFNEDYEFIRDEDPSWKYGNITEINDIYQNINITFLSSIRRNEEINVDLFKLPTQN